MTPGQNRTLATLAGGERSHHCASPVPPSTTNFITTSTGPFTDLRCQYQIPTASHTLLKGCKKKGSIRFPLPFLVDEILINETDKYHIKFLERFVNTLKKKWNKRRESACERIYLLVT